MNRLRREALPSVIRPAILTSPETLGKYGPERINAVNEADAAEAILSSSEPIKLPQTGTGIEKGLVISSSGGSRRNVRLGHGPDMAYRDSLAVFGTTLCRWFLQLSNRV